MANLKVALYAGSFNPIHNGHISIARHVLAHTDVDELWFVVSPQNPLKKSGDLWEENHRLKMVELAIKGENNMKASDYEFNLPRPSYTINTLDSLKRNYPDYTFVLLVGGDNFEYFENWRENDRILNEYGLIVYPRPGHYNGALENYHKIQVIDAPLLDISSTVIRDRLIKGKSLTGLVPEEVEDYIYKNSLGQK